MDAAAVRYMRTCITESHSQLSVDPLTALISNACEKVTMKGWCLFSIVRLNVFGRG